MGLVKMLGSTVVTVGLIGVGLQATGAYDVNKNILQPIIQESRTEGYSGLREMQLVNIEDTNHIWKSLSRQQKEEFGKRSLELYSLEDRTELVKREWQHISPQARYEIVKIELEGILAQFYRQ